MLAILADAIYIDNIKIENGTMANSILLETLQYVGFPESDIHWFTHVLLETVEPDAHSWDNIMDLVKEYNFSSVFDRCERNPLRFSRDTVEAPSLNNLFNFVSLILYMEKNGIHTFLDLKNQQDLMDGFVSGECLSPTMEHDLIHWMERISCPVVGRNNSTQILQFSACTICTVHLMYNVWNFSTLLKSLSQIEKSPHDNLFTLEMKRSLVKASNDMIGNGQCVSLTRHNPLTVPMNELETMLRKLNFSSITIYKIFDIVGPRCHLHRLIECKTSINACNTISKNDVATLMKAIVYMETHNYCEADVDKVSDFPVSQFHEWASNHSYVS